MSIFFTSSKLFICSVGRNRAEMLMAAAKAAGARGGTIALGRSVGSNPILCALSLADVYQDLLFTLLGPKEQPAVIEAVLRAAKENPKKLGGYAALVDVPRMTVRAMPPADTSNAPGKDAGSTHMESGYELITVITNSGYADDVMAAARKAGATGGTILNARGTGTEEDVKFFGITLVPEKEMLLIVAARDKVQNIIEAAGAVPTLSEPGGGIIFTTNVEKFMVLGQ